MNLDERRQRPIPLAEQFPYSSDPRQAARAWEERHQTPITNIPDEEREELAVGRD